MFAQRMLRQALRRLHRTLALRMRRRWNRDLPFNELLGDRWQRARRLGFGEGASIYDGSYVFGDVTVGRQTWIGPMTVLDGTGGLSIGDYCSISSGVQIYTHDSVKWALSGGKSAYETAPVRIGNCCYIGSHTVIAKGVTIGDHSVIGAGSFVNRVVPAHTVVAGAPAQPIGRVDIDSDGTVQLVYDAPKRTRRKAA